MKNQLEYQMISKTHSFNSKVDSSLRLIEKYNSENTYLSWSGGKDSNVLLDLCLRINPKMKVMYIKSGYGLPDGYKFMVNLIKEKNINYTEINTPVDYMELCQEYGLPHMRSSVTQKNVVSMIKKNPANEWAKENNYTAMFWGIRSEESLSRKAMLKYKGYSFIDKNGINRISPIINWTVKEIWAYHMLRNMEINPIYQKENCGETCESIRNTGWLSTDGENRGRLEWLRRNYPEQHQKVRDLCQ